jgi:hypothetical protein
MMELSLHITGEENCCIELSQEKRNETYSYRVLKIRTENYQKQITLFLSDAQARQIAETILAGLGVEAEQAEAV